MPYDLKEVAAISGMPGLYRLVKPTRAGVIVEALDEKGTRSVASARNKVSLLHEISIYTQEYDTTVPLAEVFDRIYQKHGAELALTHKSDDRDLTAFMGEILPDYDRNRVYMSDIKKLVQWYHVVSRRLPYQEAAPATTESATAAGDSAPTPEATPEAAESSATPAASEGKAKAPRKKAAKSDDEPAADEALSTAGIIPAATEDTAEGSPEAAVAKPAKKTTRKKTE
ncbi:DUF5606 family protein [Hymenobacter weizhouensis]|uniref:DUF5606 family protein n=1 Tax=Hymenobacter sp. YIM 151500-1 TaxID=2987689 RepID=UPI002227E467|nr:DUF5606 domain-containing protein [Hymenobacter sp. YIM 151500-1]UYZ64348.1 DUF5606 domain-containing protein [Hymenobacter sp. YIM 151500-1]